MNPSKLSEILPVSAPSITRSLVREDGRAGNGGKRAGAGRKGTGNVQVTVQLPPGDVEWLREQGGGNIAAAIRASVAGWRKAVEKVRE